MQSTLHIDISCHYVLYYVEHAVNCYEILGITSVV